MYAIGPGVMLFLSMHSVIKLMRGKKKFLASVTLLMGFVGSSHVCMGFLLVLLFVPTSQSYAREENWRVYIVLSECGCVCMPLRWKGVLSR